ncbi:MAG: adenylate/guanylate cyclase domain-containing protein [Spirulina sp. SIO3F2]|nr:adenylate/guanylate cyclase domain-containing protein [Spirulina sp. SIO3F2]
MGKRLTLGLSLGATYFLGRSLLIAEQVFTGKGPSTLYELVYHFLPVVLMVGAIARFRQRLTPRSLAIGLLILSWGITIVTNLPKGWADVVEPDYKGWTLGFFSIASIVPFRWPLHLVSHVGAYLYYFSINLALGHSAFPPHTTAAEFVFDLIWISAMPNFVVFLYERLSRSEFHTQQALHEAQHRSEQLLLDILPAPIANRLRQERTTIADRFEEVTVLFADIVGFTHFSAQLPPDQVVDWLNQIFSRFDRLSRHYQLEKIKTIGDAYMVVGGLPQPSPDHAQRVAQMALAMQQTLVEMSQETGQTFEMRIGIHTGPVVAGVIGLHKFAYDLWGDTVNLASRMESHGRPGKIQMTPATRNRLQADDPQGHYVCVPRGIIEVKGKGQMLTYWLEAADPAIV